ncbi:MAG TPA: ComEC/Rec2 family competence protein [Acetobacteraceae bacterium]|nr:ComEC/Rec2 family competence protein [Acetobacteraceae bacterium]
MQLATTLPRLIRLPARARLAAVWEAWLDAEQGRFTLWLPVFMGAGVVGYFDLPIEPAAWIGPAAVAAVLAAWLASRRWLPLRALAAALLAAAVGFSAAAWRTAGEPPMPVLPFRAVVLSGTVRAVDPLPVGRRVVLARPHIGGVPTGRDLRIRLRNNDSARIGAGDRVRVRALVFPPFQPSYPGGWDLARQEFFTGLGGGGFALGPAGVLARAPPQGLARRWQGLRDAIAGRIIAGLPGPRGAIAATLLTGETTAIPAADRAAFTDSGLAHLLAVAGLHIGIVMGLIFGFARLLLAANEWAALHWPGKQIAAVAALAAGGFYMALTGMHVPIIRSFAMATLVTLGLLAGRRVVSLRGLALAAAALILLEPEQVMGVSFQMSFAAVLALIAGYEALRPALTRLQGEGAPMRRIALYGLALALTSLLAGTASAPFAAYHFGRMQLYFVLSNLIAVPLAAAWVMPAGLAALALMPFGLAHLALAPMGWGIGAILFVARTVAALPAAAFDVPPMPGWGLILVALGMAWLGLWRSRLRLAGVVAIGVGLASPLAWAGPAILVSAHARLVAVRVPGHVFLLRAPRASKYTLAAWRRLWGGAAPRALPAAGMAAGGRVRCDAAACVIRLHADGPAALLLRGTAPPAAGDCAAAAVLVSAHPLHGVCRASGLAHVDRFTVWRDGAAAVWLARRGVRIETDRSVRGARPWVPPPPVPHGQRPVPGNAASHRPMAAAEKLPAG